MRYGGVKKPENFTTMLTVMGGAAPLTISISKNFDSLILKTHLSLGRD